MVVCILTTESFFFQPGLTIVGGENSRSMDLGIFVRSIEPHGPAHRDGRLHVGDRIISINGQSLEGVGHRVAVDIIKNAPEVVQLIVSQPKSGIYQYHYRIHHRFYEVAPESDFATDRIIFMR